MEPINLSSYREFFPATGLHVCDSLHTENQNSGRYASYSSKHFTLWPLKSFYYDILFCWLLMLLTFYCAEFII